LTRDVSTHARQRERLLATDAGAGLALDLVAVSDQGPKRPENQDAWALHRLDPPHGCALVLADGLGGHPGGLQAARVAVRTAGAALAAAPDPRGGLPATFLEAAAAIRRRPAAGLTTLVAAVVGSGTAHVASVGDSRAYLVTGSGAAQVTRDHSELADWLHQHGIPPEAAAAARPPRRLSRNRLTRCLPTSGDALDLVEVAAPPGSLVVLCSDGLWSRLESRDLCSLLDLRRPLLAACEELCDLVLGRGATDNVTLAACRVAEVGPSVPDDVSR
jgi:PPM family protein phosphatase